VAGAGIRLGRQHRAVLAGPDNSVERSPRVRFPSARSSRHLSNIGGRRHGIRGRGHRERCTGETQHASSRLARQGLRRRVLLLVFSWFITTSTKGGRRVCRTGENKFESWRDARADASMISPSPGLGQLAYDHMDHSAGSMRALTPPWPRIALIAAFSGPASSGLPFKPPRWRIHFGLAALRQRPRSRAPPKIISPAEGGPHSATASFCHLGSNA